MAGQRPASGSFDEARAALDRLEQRDREQWERARRAVYDEAIAHFRSRHEHAPGQTVRFEAVMAVLTALRDGFWGRGSSHHENDG